MDKAVDDARIFRRMQFAISLMQRRRIRLFLCGGRHKKAPHRAAPPQNKRFFFRLFPRHPLKNVCSVVQ
jgi:hypothetical protein